MLIKSKKIEYVERQSQQITGFVRADYIPDDEPKKNDKAPLTPLQARPGQKDELERKIREAEKEAYDRGLAEGMIRGSDVEKKKLQTTLKGFEKAIQEVSHLKSGIIERQEGDILNLVLMVAKKVIHQEVQGDKTVYLSILKEAVRNILDKEGMKIRLSGEDYDHMLEANPDFLTSFEGIRNPSFERDDSLHRGDVVVETMFGEVDARLDRQFGEIASAFLHKG